MRRWYQATAVLSDCGKYRYSLTRRWAEGGRELLFIMLNPSTADATLDDATIRRCIIFAACMGYHAIRVVNLFAFRSTKPSGLRRVSDPVGPDNERYIIEAVGLADAVVCAWGAVGGDFVSPVYIEHLLKMIPQPLCLGVTKFGHPNHPLMLPRSAALQGYEPKKETGGTNGRE